MTWAIYRIHYGLDFLEPSIKSIINDVDKIFIFYSQDPWIKAKYINYKNQHLDFPKNPEDVENFLINKFKNNKKIIFKKHECNTPMNQFGDLFNLACTTSKTKPEYVLFMEPDMIFGHKQLRFLKIELDLKFWLKSIIAKQIEIWKFDNIKKERNTYRIPLRKRIGPVLWNVKKNQDVINTSLGGGPKDKKNEHFSILKILNLGFSFNKETMLYKHLTSLVFSKIIGDSLPDESWYEDKWLNWKPETRNLEISYGFQHKIKKATKFKIPDKYLKYLK